MPYDRKERPAARRRAWHLLTAGIVTIGIATGVVSAAAQAPDIKDYEAEAQSVMKRLRTTLLKEVKAAMARSPSAAIGVCQQRAPAITNRIAAESGWRVSRTSLKTRNPANRPTPAERAILLDFEKRFAAGEPAKRLRSVRVVTVNGQRTVHVMQAIPTGAPCLACHGSALAPKIAGELRRLYPTDRATGFKEGDIRGAFTLYKTLAKGDGAAGSRQ